MARPTDKDVRNINRELARMAERISGSSGNTSGLREDAAELSRRLESMATGLRSGDSDAGERRAATMLQESARMLRDYSKG